MPDRRPRPASDFLRESRAVPLLVSLLLSACAWHAGGSARCVVDREPAPLPAGLEEASGLAPADLPGTKPRDGVRPSEALWVLNDSGWEPVLKAVDLDGRVLGALRVPGIRAVDIEALERADCPSGRCLYLGDVGDNAEVRDDPTIHRIPETTNAEAVTTGLLSLPVRFPDGPRDVEALFVLPGEAIHLVTKGRNHPVTVYRYPLPLRPGERVVLEELQALGAGPPSYFRRVTGAAVSPDGRHVAVRTYQSLELFRVDGGRLVPLPGAKVRLRTVREAQGEAVAFLEDGSIALASEAGPLGRRGGLVVLRCPDL